MSDLELGNTSPSDHIRSLPNRALEVLLRYKKTALAILVGSGIAAMAVPPHERSQQHKVDEEHAFLDAQFRADNVSPEKMLREITCTNLYGKTGGIEKSARWARGAVSVLGSERADSLRHYPSSGCVLLSGVEMESADQIRKLVDEIRSKNPSAIVAIDFEGGYVRFPQLTAEEINKFHIPKFILAQRDAEVEYLKSKGKDPKHLGMFPSAEWMGTKYEITLQKGREKEKEAFLAGMKDYGAGVAKFCESVGINMIL